MAVLNFPANPAFNDTYTENGITYTWNGTYWQANSGTSLDDFYVKKTGDTMTGDLTLPGGGDATEALQKQEVEALIAAVPGNTPLWVENAGELAPVTDTNNVNIGTGNVLLNADGSIEALGSAQLGNGNFVVRVGNYITAKNYIQTGTVVADGVTPLPFGITAESNGDSSARNATVYARNRDDTGRNFIGLNSAATTTFSVSTTGDVNIGGVIPSAPNIALSTSGTIKGPDLVDDFGNTFTSYQTLISSSAGKQRGQYISTTAFKSTVFSSTGVSSSFRHTSFLADGSEISRFRVGTDGSIYTYDDIGDISSFILSDGTAVFNKDIQSTSQNSGPLAGFRNQIINGDFQIWQRGDSITTDGVSSGNFFADRFKVNTGTAGIVLSKTDIDVIPGFAYAVTTDGGSSGTAGHQIIQRIELPAENKAGQFVLNSVWTVSYYATSQTLPTAPAARFRGSGAISLSVTDFKVVPGFTPVVVGSKTWTRYQAQITVDQPPNNPGGTVNSISLEVGISFGVLNTDIAGEMITGVQVEAGPVATPFERRPIAVELAMCERYFFQYPKASYLGVANLSLGTSQSTTVGLFSSVALFPQSMRADPSVSFTGSPELAEVVFNAPVGNATSMSFSKYALSVTASPAPFANAGTVCNLKLQSGSYIQFDAEL